MKGTTGTHTWGRPNTWGTPFRGCTSKGHSLGEALHGHLCGCAYLGPPRLSLPAGRGSLSRCPHPRPRPSTYSLDVPQGGQQPCVVWASPHALGRSEVCAVEECSGRGLGCASGSQTGRPATAAHRDPWGHRDTAPGVSAECRSLWPPQVVPREEASREAGRWHSGAGLRPVGLAYVH